MLRKYLLLWLVLSSGLAALWPAVVGNTGFDPFIATRHWLGALVAITMFCIGSVLPLDEVREVFSRWPLVIAGTAVQYLSMPALAWLLTSLFHLERELEIGVILVGCVPGAMASNVLTMVARGNVSYSVGLTTCATLLSPLMVPFALKITLGTGADPRLLSNTALLLCFQIVLPTLSGFALSRRSASFAAGACRWAEIIANLSILWIIAVVVALNRGRLEHLHAPLVGILLLLNILGYVAGDLGGRLLRLTPGMRRALIIEVGMQNAGVGASLATSLFPDQPGVALPCGLFAFGCMLTGTLLARLMGRVPPITADPVAPPRVDSI